MKKLRCDAWIFRRWMAVRAHWKAVHEQEAVIVGYTEPRRSRKYFGSLVLAVRDKANRRWVYAGHVGTGFYRPWVKGRDEVTIPESSPS
jgi:ATP-dependent DNA ligase